MQTPLRYQITEFDCGTVSLMNAISYLFKRNDIPVELIRAIHLYTIDCYGTDGKKSDEFLPYQSINKMCKWFTKYTNDNDFEMAAIYLKGEDVNYDNIEKCIRKNGVVFIKCYRKEPQYVIITNINELNTYMFDSYYCSDDFDDDINIRVVQSKPCEYNRIVRTSRVFSETKDDFALGKITDRECILMNKKGDCIFYAKDI